MLLTNIAGTIYGAIPYDGKYIINNLKHMLHPSVIGNLIADITICQSHAEFSDLANIIDKFEQELSNQRGEYVSFMPTINPLGPWTGGINVDCGCTNRKLGSDMGDGVTGGGLMGKDLSKADVSVNIVCHLKAVASGKVVTAICSIGDENVTFTYPDGRTEMEPFADIVDQARRYIINACRGSFEKFAEWGLIRPMESAE